MTLLETMRWDPGNGIWLLDRHLNRLRSSARYLGMTLPEAEIGRLLEGVVGEYPPPGTPSGPGGRRALAPDGAVGGASADRGPRDRQPTGRPVRCPPLPQTTRRAPTRRRLPGTRWLTMSCW